MIFVILLIYSLVLSECSTIRSTSSIDTLRMVHVLFRHGVRAPTEFFPNDPWKNKSSQIWPDGLGQLTKLGRSTSYELGLWLRERYGSFIKKRFHPEEFHIISTDVDRTLMSAAIVVGAFYRPDYETKFRDGLLWTPTPVHTTPLSKDKLLILDASCPRIATEYSKVDNIPEVKDFYEENEELFKFISQKSGVNSTEFSDVNSGFDALRIERLYNLTLPDWAINTYDEMNSLSKFYFKRYSYTPELKMLRGSPLLRTMTENMENKSRNELPERKMLMFCGHDTTISVLLDSIGVFNEIPPPFSATVLVELHQISNNNFVKIFYKNDTNFDNPPHELVIPGCSLECPLSKWKYLLSDVILSQEEWDKECNQGFSNANIQERIPEMIEIK